MYFDNFVCLYVKITQHAQGQNGYIPCIIYLTLDPWTRNRYAETERIKHFCRSYVFITSTKSSEIGKSELSIYKILNNLHAPVIYLAVAK